MSVKQTQDRDRRMPGADGALSDDSGRSAVERVADELGGALFLLIGGDGAVYGAEDFLALALVGRALAEEVGVYVPDDRGRVGYRVPRPPAAGLPDQTRRIRRRVAEARRAGASFVVCYHVEGDPRWRAAWSADYTARQAAQAMINFVRHGLLFDELE